MFELSYIQDKQYGSYLQRLADFFYITKLGLIIIRSAKTLLNTVCIIRYIFTVNSLVTLLTFFCFAIFILNTYKKKTKYFH